MRNAEFIRETESATKPWVGQSITADLIEVMWERVTRFVWHFMNTLATATFTIFLHGDRERN